MKASFQRADLFVLWMTLIPDLSRIAYTVLLTDAEIPKDVAEDFVGGDFADDGAEVVDGFSDVLRGEVGREAEGEAFLGAEEGSAGVAESLDMALVSDQGCVAVSE